jgi:nucleoside-diphosphate-sugar epimerase
MSELVRAEKVLVTGGSGLIGRHLVKSLAAGGFSIGVLDLVEPEGPVDAYHRGDVTDPDFLADTLPAWDAVVHLAALLPASESSPEEIYRVNAYGTFCVAETCARGGVARLIYCSSESVLGFAMGEGLPEPRYLPLDEDHPTIPVDPYGLSKLAGEEACRAAASRSSLRALAIRPPWIWVPEEYEIYRAYTAEPDRPDWIRDLWAYVQVEDLAAAVSMALITKDLEPFEVLFVSAADNGTERSSRFLIKEHLTSSPRIEGTFGRRESFISSERARKRLSYVPKRSWTEFLA